MILFKTVKDLTSYLVDQNQNNKSVGFVPTMGALHNGHIKLIKKCKENTDIVVVSIFVNPTQFNNKEDLIKYPKPIDKDIQLVHNLCDVLFLPSYEEIYPANWDIRKKYDLGTIETILEGSFRPGHFQGVAMVLDRLFNIVQPHQVFFGQKDYQQCMVVHKLISLINDFKTIHFNIVATERAASGLALSSRNIRLSTDGLQTASYIYQALLSIKNNIQPGDTCHLIDKTIHQLKDKNIEVEYISIADSETLAPITSWDGKQRAVTLIAAYVEGVRLIDNLVLN